ncbi:MAG: AAA family ATPase [Thermoleophilia bacterium]
MDEAARLERAAPGLGALLAPGTAALAAGVARTEARDDGAHLLMELLTARPRHSSRAGGPDAAAARETRRTVTIVFADAAPAGPVPEAVARDAAGRWFAVAREILERHGGTVERYIGDAVMAVFGLERRREDDALRAVLAAVEMRDALEGLNAELALSGAPPLAIRAGVNTGNLVAGAGADRQRLVTGDAVNVAARLQQAAGPGEVLAGDATVALTGGQVRGDTLEPLAVRGRAEPVPVLRVRSVAQGRPRIRHEVRAPLAGRDAELGRLMEALQDAAGGRGRLAVLAGDPGVGKSRLAEEFSARATAAGARVLHGHCAAHGEGITFRPIVEVVHEAAGIAPGDPAAVARELIAAAAGGDAAVTARIASLCGLSDVVHPLPELFWAVRRLLGRLAARRPVVVQVDDVHRSEPTLAELLVHLAEAEDAQLLVLATARSDIRRRRPEIVEAAGPRVVELGPLGPEATAAMVAGLLDGAVPPAVVDRIVRAADGNPLFVEQLLAMMIGSGALERDGGRWRVRGDIERLAIPPSIEVLVATRVDALPEAERAALEAAAVAGNEFTADAVAMLAGMDEVAPLLDGLVERDLLHPPGESGAHRFAHPMICDVAYDGLLKRTRAELHERFAA